MLYTKEYCITQSINRINTLLLYNSTIFSKTKQNYNIYKQELLTIVIFIKKYNYILQYFKPSIILIDYYLLIYFLKLSQLKDIYTK